LLRRRIRWAWICLTPALLTVAAVAGWPLIRTSILAFTDTRLSQMAEIKWVGFENLIAVVRDPIWWLAVRNTLVFTVGSVSIEVVLGLCFALMLNSKLTGVRALWAVALIPWAVPTIVTAQMWKWMYHDIFGILNELLIVTGLADQPIAWLAEPNLSMVAVIIADVWKTTPFVTLLLLAGLQTIPPQLIEAARIDGAGPLARLRYIIIPLLTPAIIVAVLFRMLDAVRVFDLIYVMTSNARSTVTVSVYARQQLVDFQNVGYGSAASLMIFLLIGILSIVCVLALRPRIGASR